jgi:hypothetical protein
MPNRIAFTKRSSEFVISIRRPHALFSTIEVVDYFKGLADETGLPYQKLIDLYLLDCAKKRKQLTMKWVP